MPLPAYVVIQAEDYLPNIGGIANHVDGLSCALARAGRVVTVLSTRKDLPAGRNLAVWQKREFVREGVRVVEKPILYSPRNCLLEAQIKWRFTRQIESRIRRGECDVVHYHWFGFDRQVVGPLRGKVPVVFTNHSSQFLEMAERGTMDPRIAADILANERIIAPSRELVEKTIQLGYPAAKCHYIPNGIDGRVYRPDADARVRMRSELGVGEDTVVVLCARRPVEKNGILDFCEALGRLPEEARGRILVLFAGLGDVQRGAGDPYVAKVLERVDGLHCEIEMRLLGEVPQDKMRDYYRAADISVLPSRREATSIAGLQAMACGAPIVGTNVGGIPEIVQDEVDGLLVPAASNPDVFAVALGRLIQDEGTRKTFGERASRKVLAEFTWDVCAQKVVEVYALAMQDLTICNRG